jgi:hypothetical protein
MQRNCSNLALCCCFRVKSVQTSASPCGVNLFCTLPLLFNTLPSLIKDRYSATLYSLDLCCSLSRTYISNSCENHAINVKINLCYWKLLFTMHTAWKSSIRTCRNYFLCFVNKKELLHNGYIFGRKNLDSHKMIDIFDTKLNLHVGEGI